MKFRTEIEIAPFTAQIGYRNRILSLGSCFAERMAEHLVHAKIPVTSNPTGVLFNPLSIASAIRAFESATPITEFELHPAGESWFHYDFHGSFSAPTPTKALEAMNRARTTGTKALHEADRIILTFGTAWVYEHQGAVVANCHRQPFGEFSRRRLSVEEIVTTFAPLLKTTLADKQIILTVSPVRHLGDGLPDNAVSKAILRLAAEELSARFDRVHYFPAFEIVTDDLRDYRYYGDDLVHPSSQAIKYIWEHFVTTVLDSEAQRLLPRIEQLTTAATHRPQNPDSEAHKIFCRKMLQEIDTLPEADLHAEREYFERFLK